MLSATIFTWIINRETLSWGHPLIQHHRQSSNHFWKYRTDEWWFIFTVKSNYRFSLFNDDVSSIKDFLCSIHVKFSISETPNFGTIKSKFYSYIMFLPYRLRNASSLSHYRPLFSSWYNHFSTGKIIIFLRPAVILVFLFTSLVGWSTGRRGKRKWIRWVLEKEIEIVVRDIIKYNLFNEETYNIFSSSRWI